MRVGDKIFRNATNIQRGAAMLVYVIIFVADSLDVLFRVQCWNLTQQWDVEDLESSVYLGAELHSRKKVIHLSTTFN